MTRQRTLHWLYVSLYVAAIIIVARLVFNSAWDKGVAWGDKIGLIVIALAALVILKRINPDLGGLLSGKVSVLADRKTSEISANLFLTVLGIMASAVGLMAPTPTTESKPGFIEATVKSILANVRAIREGVTRVEAGQQRNEKKLDALAPPTDAVLQKKISGMWGEDNCSVTYKYSFEDGGLIAKSVKNAPGMEGNDESWKGGDLRFSGGILTTTTIQDFYGQVTGGTVSFTYKSEAGVETLARADKLNRVVTHFTRC